ncbi:MAG TPA: hypothetical protein VKS22_16585 [Candidatus Binataceae bacterium]|nr:hypothetical protein [Candidatus Binataceae bacterium]
MLGAGAYRYEIRQGATVVAVEEARVAPKAITATRREADGLTVREADATLDDAGRIERISLRYASSLFRRDASYRADGDSFRGNVSAMAGRNEIVIKLGRFGEIDGADLTIFRALILAHVRERGQIRWTGRVAVIDHNTLAAASLKQTCRLGDARGAALGVSVPGDGSLWIYEARMGDVEEIAVDRTGSVVRRRDSRGSESRLIDFKP